MAEKGTTYCGFLKHWEKTPYSIKTGGMCPTPGNPMYETYQYTEEAFVAGCKFIIEQRKISKKVEADNSTSTNTESFQSLWLYIDDMVNCKVCSDKDKVDGIRLILDEMRSETINISQRYTQY